MRAPRSTLNAIYVVDECDWSEQRTPGTVELNPLLLYYIVACNSSLGRSQSLTDTLRFPFQISFRRQGRYLLGSDGSLGITRIIMDAMAYRLSS